MSKITKKSLIESCDNAELKAKIQKIPSSTIDEMLKFFDDLTPEFVVEHTNGKEEGEDDE